MPNSLVTLSALILGGLTIICGFVILLVWLVCMLGRRGGGRADRRRQAEEARTAQELHRLLTDMTARVDALEAILLEQSRKQEGGHHDRNG